MDKTRLDIALSDDSRRRNSDFANHPLRNRRVRRAHEQGNTAKFAVNFRRSYERYIRWFLRTGGLNM